MNSNDESIVQHFGLTRFWSYSCRLLSAKVIKREKESSERKGFNPLVDEREVKKGCQMKFAAIVVDQ